ncbi:MAG: hypothetical protein IOC64_01475 [Methylobacterium sp.]|jgi:hypothetical protein|nr:hypothetical protein [Methylobacterium sp.]MCA3606120.1 hypothetical protein [Methylobacterium sp.]MCA3609641.1 hypothetical protein [Methylobacterium sp.]MCA3618312.1 hypothetical protein [Methylobacterium sp.]MCA3621384.1 hypothetical protein [Methylobacterium sp.]
MNVPEVFRYIAMGVFEDDMDKYPDMEGFFVDHIRDYISKNPGHVQELHRFVTVILASNPSDEALQRIWFGGQIFVYFTPLGARLAFEAIRKACARLIEDGTAA